MHPRFAMFLSWNKSIHPSFMILEWPETDHRQLTSYYYDSVVTWKKCPHNKFTLYSTSLGKKHTWICYESNRHNHMPWTLTHGHQNIMWWSGLINHGNQSLNLIGLVGTEKKQPPDKSLKSAVTLKTGQGHWNSLELDKLVELIIL